MSTDTQETDPVTANTEANDQAPNTAEMSPEPTTPNDAAHEPDPGLADESSEPQPGNVAPAVAATAWDDEDLEPGDDIGNRIDGPAHHERITTEAETEAASKNRRRPRNKKRAAAATDRPARTDEAARGHKGKAQAAARERPAFRVAEEVFGRVMDITDEAIIIDLSGKAQAMFDRREIADEDLPQVGDHFVANVLGDGSRGGMIVLTRDLKRADESKKVVEAAAESGELVLGLVTGVIKGGVEVDVSGLRAFAPGSHVELKLGADLHHLVGKRLPFKVMKYAKHGKEVVLSRREQLETEAANARKEALAKLEAGAVVPAVVRSVVDWGVFVAIPSANNIEGLIHITEASHDRTAKLADQFKPGDPIEVKVLRIDDKGKLWLSRKAVEADPWDKVAEQFHVGSRHTGRVVRMQPFGAFVELAPGIDGLIRTVDLSARRINDPSEVVKIGDEIEVVVVHLDASQRKIGLHPAPPGDEKEAPQRLAPHRTVRVSVVSAEPAGLIVRVLGNTGASSRGFIPAGHTATARGTDLRREFPVGTVLEAKVIEMDNRRGEAKLSIRALKEDSEKAAYSEYRAQVARESKFGTFGDLFAKRNSGNN